MTDPHSNEYRHRLRITGRNLDSAGMIAIIEMAHRKHLCQNLIIFGYRYSHKNLACILQTLLEPDHGRTKTNDFVNIDGEQHQTGYTLHIHRSPGRRLSDFAQRNLNAVVSWPER